LRDVVQNHLLQVLALVAMDPPAGASADDAQDKKAEVFRRRPGAAPGSTTETYVALRLEIDNWRWADVPIFMRPARPCRTGSPRCGCCCAARPGWPSGPCRPRAGPNEIVLRIDPDPALRLQLSALAAAVAARGPLTRAARHRGSAAACSWTSGWKV
jgi:glucose-6-phosphate 1-dehydrogenase